MTTVVTREDVLAAMERVRAHVRRTPLREMSHRGHRVWLKCESLQTGGAFKLRGATNRLEMMSGEERARGVVAFSSGNHAQGVAIAARRLGIAAAIVMPSDAPRLKIDATRAQGAEIILYDRRRESRVAIARALADERGAILVPSFDDPAIVAGQGTAGLELAEQLADDGAPPASRIVVPTGGGGLAAGLALACPHAEIVCVEPEGWDDMGRSLAAGTVVPVAADAPPTLCDALQTPLVSPITFGILKERQAIAVFVTETEVRAALRYAASALSLTLEAGGVVALAAMLAGKVGVDGVTVLLMSGSNIDPALHAEIVAGADAR